MRPGLIPVSAATSPMVSSGFPAVDCVTA